MSLKAKSQTKSAVTALFFVFLIGASLYSPGVTELVYLDSANTLSDILQSPQFDYERLSTLVVADQSGPMGRPVTFASFALQRILGCSTMACIRHASIGLHLLTGFFVFYFLIRAMSFRTLSSGKYICIAVFCSAYWILSPLHASTVLYGVQRMTILATLFSLAALILANKMLDAWFQGRRMASVIFLGASLILLTLAVLSKESALVAPCLFAFFLIFRASAENEEIALRLKVLSAIILVVVSVIAALGLYSIWPSVISGYELREFTISERLLYQSYAILDYAVSFIYPESSAFGLYHDDFYDLVLERSRFEAVAIWICLLILAVLSLASLLKGRLVYASFGYLFFLVALMMESSVIPLEMYFEHRAYLPSVGILFILFEILRLVIDKYEYRSSVAVVAICALLYSASQLNDLAIRWGNRFLFVTETYAHHPESIRAVSDMAELFASSGDLATALLFATKADELNKRQTEFELALRNVALHCLAGEPPELDSFRFDASAPLFSRSDITSKFIVKIFRGGICDDSTKELLLPIVERYTLNHEEVSERMFRDVIWLVIDAERYMDARNFLEYGLEKFPNSVDLRIQYLYLLRVQGKQDDSLLSWLSQNAENPWQRYQIAQFL